MLFRDVGIPWYLTLNPLWQLIFKILKTRFIAGQSEVQQVPNKNHNIVFLHCKYKLIYFSRRCKFKKKFTNIYRIHFMSYNSIFLYCQKIAIWNNLLLEQHCDYRYAVLCFLLHVTSYMTSSCSYYLILLVSWYCTFSYQTFCPYYNESASAVSWYTLRNKRLSLTTEIPHHSMGETVGKLVLKRSW